MRGRFGADADAMWGSFRGDLTTSDRIDLLIRDADTEWPCAFGARTVFELPATANDEPFGSEWEPLDPVDAEELWRGVAAGAVARSVAEALRVIARSWDVPVVAFDVGTVAATDRIVVAGPSAVAALIEAFAAARDLDWSAQVTVIATAPAHRQLAAAAAALLNSSKPTSLLSARGAEEARRHAAARLVVSDDAAPEDRAAAERLARAS